MELFPEKILDQLKENGRKQAKVKGTAREIDFEPVVKIFTPDAGATWLLTEISPDDPDIAFGLCDLGLGYPELGYVRMSELKAVRGKLGLPAERDTAFFSQRSISEYAAQARRQGSIMA